MYQQNVCCFDQFKIGFWSILGPQTLPKPLKAISLNLLGSHLEGLLVPLGAQDPPKTPPKTDFYGFWTPT